MPYVTKSLSTFNLTDEYFFGCFDWGNAACQDIIMVPTFPHWQNFLDFSSVVFFHFSSIYNVLLLLLFFLTENIIPLENNTQLI